MPQSKAWQSFERVIATIFGTFRVPLSGINSRHNAGDIILPAGLSMLVECKTRISSSHWTLYEDACKDALKNGVDPNKTLLFFKQKSKRGSIVTMNTDLFELIWNVPGVRDLFAKPFTGKYTGLCAECGKEVVEPFTYHASCEPQ